MRGHIHLLHHIYNKRPSQRIANLPIKRISEIPLSCQLAGPEGGPRDTMITLEELLPLIQSHQWPETKFPNDAKQVQLDHVSHYRYKIKDLGNMGKIITDKSYKRVGRSKEIDLITNWDLKSVKHHLRIAYAHLERGSRVEFHLRPPADKPEFSVDWTLRHLPYMRPEVILRSMPGGTQVIVPPVENYLAQDSKSNPNDLLRELIWAFSRLPEDRREAQQTKEVDEGLSEILGGKARQWKNGNAAFQNAIRKSRQLLDEKVEKYANRDLRKSKESAITEEANEGVARPEDRNHL